MNNEKYSELQDRLSDVERDLKVFIIETLKEYDGRISIAPPKKGDDSNNHYPVTSTLYGRHDFPRIHISSVYLNKHDSILADGIEEGTSEERKEFSIESEQLADVFSFIGQATEQNTSLYKELYVGQRVYWNDPDQGLSSGVYNITILPEEIEDDSIITISNGTGESQVYPTELETKITKIVFRKQTDDGDIVAIFPEEQATKHSKDMMMCYAHMGQHSSASYDWVNEDTTPATESEYADLLSELKNVVGYTALEIVTEYKPLFKLN